MTTAAASVTTRGAPPAVVVVGPVPPPFHGGSVATSFVLRSRIASAYRLLHLDTTDRRGLANIGRFDAGNVLLALRHTARLLALLATARPAAVYVPLAQNRLGLLRDAALVLPSLAAGRAVVLHVHGSGLRDFYDGADVLTRALIRTMLGRAARVIVLGDALRPMVEGLVREERVAALPNGTPDVFSAARRTTRRPGPVRLLYLGNLREAKGVLELLDATVRLRRAGHDVELHLAGGFSSPADEDAVRARLLPIAEHVRLHGVVEGARKERLLQDADIFAFPSHTEGHPYVVLEAMAAGLPVVTTTLPTLRETVVDGHTGLLVAPGDATALAEGLATLVRDPDRRNRLGAAGRARFEAHYSFDVWSARLARIMAEVVA